MTCTTAARALPSANFSRLSQNRSRERGEEAPGPRIQVQRGNDPDRTVPRPTPSDLRRRLRVARIDRPKALELPPGAARGPHRTQRPSQPDDRPDASHAVASNCASRSASPSHRSVPLDSASLSDLFVDRRTRGPAPHVELHPTAARTNSNPTANTPTHPPTPPTHAASYPLTYPLTYLLTSPLTHRRPHR